MHPGSQAVSLRLHAERVVEVLRLVGVDREREEVAQVDAIVLVVARLRGKRRVLAADALVPEEPFQDGLDVVGAPEDLLEAGAAAPEAEEHEVADRRLPRTLAVDDDGDAALEERLADEELAAPGELADDEIQAFRRASRARCAGRRRGPRPSGSADRRPP